MSERYLEFPGFSDWDTSKKAAEAISGPAAALREKVWNYINSIHGGSTCDAAEVALGMRHQTCSARIRELVLAGRLRDTGVRRKTRSGRTANVYVTMSKSAA